MAAASASATATEESGRTNMAAKARADAIAAAAPAEGALPGSLRAANEADGGVGSASKAPRTGRARPGRSFTGASPGVASDAAAAGAGPGPITESVSPDMGYPSPVKPVKGGNEGDSVLAQAMTHMHRAQADAFNSAGFDGDAPFSFAAVYAALLDRFKWGVLIAIAVCVGVLVATAVGVDPGLSPPFLLPLGDNFREVHAARAPFFSRGGSSDSALRMRLVWGISPDKPIDRREYPHATNPTQIGDVGDAVWANATRMSVGARCFLDLCGTAELKDSARATGGVSAGYTADCWIRDFKTFVDATAGTNDQCGHTFATWDAMTGCPESCDCTAEYGITNGLGAAPTDKGCRGQIEAQEKKWWEAVYAFLRDVPGNFDRYSKMISGEKLGCETHQRWKQVLREVRDCPADGTGSMAWRYTFADIPLTALDDVPASTGKNMERAWEAWWAEKYADGAGECKKVGAMWPGFVYTPPTEAWGWEGTFPGDWFNAMDAVQLDIIKVVLIGHVLLALGVTALTRSLPLGLTAAAATAVVEAWMVSFIVLRVARLGAVEAIILCIVPAAVAPVLTHAAMAYAKCDLPGRNARVRAMLLDAGAAPLTAAVGLMCATGCPMWGITEPVKEASMYMFVLAFGIIFASVVFGGFVAATAPGHGLLGDFSCTRNGTREDEDEDEDSPHGKTGAMLLPAPQMNGKADAMALVAPQQNGKMAAPGGMAPTLALPPLPPSAALAPLTPPPPPPPLISAPAVEDNDVKPF